MATRILIVEDEAELAALISDYVVAAGYEAEIVADGGEALAKIRRRSPDLIVLDIMLPGLDGLSLCKAVRACSDVPIIMVTARVEEIDRLLGLETGADDYLCKPFSPRELVARIKALLRRQRTAEENPPLLRNDESALAIWVGTQQLELTPTEYSLLSAMLKRSGTIFSRAQLLDIASRDSLDVNDRAIDSHIKNLRRKLAGVLPHVEIIHSIYGLGYRVDL
jgi:two-component system, OmpR family, response regulator BaeR